MVRKRAQILQVHNPLNSRMLTGRKRAARRWLAKSMARNKNQDAYMPGPDTRSEQVLRASEISYRRLFETAEDGILILDADTGRINDVKPFLFRLLGFSRSAMVGRTAGELSPFKDIESNQAMLERLQQHGYVRYENLPLETRDGRKIAVEFVSNVYQAGDLPASWLGNRIGHPCERVSK